MAHDRIIPMHFCCIVSVHVQDSAWHLAAGYGRAEVLQTLYKLLVEHKDEIRLRFLLKKKIKLTADEAVEAVLNISNTKGAPHNEQHAGWYLLTSAALASFGGGAWHCACC